MSTLEGRTIKVSEQNEWLAPNQAALPDFIICGAMKSGTTTLRSILNQHPDVFIPDDEIHFFDMDNIVQHPDFNVFKQGRWYSHNIKKAPEFYWQWYSSHFEPAKKGQLVGEDSTTYLASSFAAQRIASQNKEVKLVIMLRHPTARAYSHYWHMVKAGRAMFNFEDTLKYLPHNILGRSAYLSQLQTIFTHFPKAQVKVILFETFLANKVKTIKDTCDFLGVDFDKLPNNVLDTHVNQARIPRFIYLHLLKSRMFRNSNNNPYDERFPNNTFEKDKSKKYALVFKCLYDFINPLVVNNPPVIDAGTKYFLDEYFYHELQGLDELLGQDILSTWFKNK